MKNLHNARGFTLVEVLIALVILAIGLLGMATLMMSSLQSSQGAYMRSQASLLTYDIVERMRANREQALTSDAYVVTKNTAATSNPNCKGSGCTPSNQARQDLYDWRKALEDNIPGSKASIARANTNEYTIEIEWSDAGRALEKNGDADTPSSFNLRVNL